MTGKSIFLYVLLRMISSIFFCIKNLSLFFFMHSDFFYRPMKNLGEPFTFCVLFHTFNLNDFEVYFFLIVNFFYIVCFNFLRIIPNGFCSCFWNAITSYLKLICSTFEIYFKIINIFKQFGHCFINLPSTFDLVLSRKTCCSLAFFLFYFFISWKSWLDYLKLPKSHGFFFMN